jgi:hypothetical protein
MTLPVRERSVFTVRSLSVSLKLFNWVSVNVGTNPDNWVCFNPVIIETAIFPICSSLFASINAASDIIRRIRRRTHSVMNVADTDGFTMLRYLLWRGSKAEAIAIPQINTVISGQKAMIARAKTGITRSHN